MKYNTISLNRYNRRSQKIASGFQITTRPWKRTNDCPDLFGKKNAVKAGYDFVQRG